MHFINCLRRNLLLTIFLFCYSVAFCKTRVIVFEHVKNGKAGEYFGDLIFTDFGLADNMFLSFFRDTTYCTRSHRIFSFDSSQFDALSANLLNTTMQVGFLSKELVCQCTEKSADLIQMRLYDGSGVLEYGFSGVNLRKSKKWIKQLIVALKADQLTRKIDFTELNNLMCILKRSCKIELDSGEDDFNAVKFRKSSKQSNKL